MYLNRLVQHKLKSYKINRALRNICATEIVDEFKAKRNSLLLRSHLHNLEHVAKVIPSRDFGEVKERSCKKVQSSR